MDENINNKTPEVIVPGPLGVQAGAAPIAPVTPPSIVLPETPVASTSEGVPLQQTTTINVAVTSDTTVAATVISTLVPAAATASMVGPYYDIHVRFRDRCKLFNAYTTSSDIKEDSKCVVETEDGPQFAQMVKLPKIISDGKIEGLYKFLRVATPDDIKHYYENIQKEKEAFKACQQKIEEKKLEMKLVEADFSLDRAKIVFYFTAEKRTDFRELVKDLAYLLKARIEMRQIGVRDEAKMLGGYGCCGRELCCVSFLKDFIPVTIKMAKEQHLPLNQTKISGMCGRLMCCLAYEQGQYESIKNAALANKNALKTGGCEDCKNKEAHAAGSAFKLPDEKKTVEPGKELRPPVTQPWNKHHQGGGNKPDNRDRNRERPGRDQQNRPPQSTQSAQGQNQNREQSRTNPNRDQSQRNNPRNGQGRDQGQRNNQNRPPRPWDRNRQVQQTTQPVKQVQQTTQQGRSQLVVPQQQPAPSVPQTQAVKLDVIDNKQAPALSPTPSAPVQQVVKTEEQTPVVTPVVVPIVSPEAKPENGEQK